MDPKFPTPRFHLHWTPAFIKSSSSGNAPSTAILPRTTGACHAIILAAATAASRLAASRPFSAPCRLHLPTRSCRLSGRALMLAISISSTRPFSTVCATRRAIHKIAAISQRVPRRPSLTGATPRFQSCSWTASAPPTVRSTRSLSFSPSASPSRSSPLSSFGGFSCKPGHNVASRCSASPTQTPASSSRLVRPRSASRVRLRTMSSCLTCGGGGRTRLARSRRPSRRCCLSAKPSSMSITSSPSTCSNRTSRTARPSSSSSRGISSRRSTVAKSSTMPPSRGRPSSCCSRRTTTRVRRRSARCRRSTIALWRRSCTSSARTSSAARTRRCPTRSSSSSNASGRLLRERTSSGIARGT
mmetsp:Transcript_7366/g.19335  ORF Transcript_7366/g.19335 Transcript_7366/m.19335 type:complete len:358 (-) Transcript_7366:1804-2877(-)